MKTIYKISFFILTIFIAIGSISFYLKYLNEQLPSFPEYGFKSVKNSKTVEEQKLVIFLNQFEEICKNRNFDKLKDMYSENATITFVRLKLYGLRKEVEVQSLESYFNDIKTELALREMLFSSSKHGYQLKNKDYLISSNGNYALVISDVIERLYVPVSQQIKDEVYNELKEDGKHSKDELDNLLKTEEVTMEFIIDSAALIDISKEPYKIERTYSILPI